jgi:membrane protease YdiL (CAAX protease family)
MSTADASKRQGVVHRYPVAAFFVLAFALGAGTVYLVAQGVLPSGLALASVLSASVAGIIITAVVDGKAGLKRMLDQLLIWRVGIGYWLFALLFLVPTVLLGSLANPLFNGDSPDFRGLYSPLQIIPLFVAFFIVSGLGQELGWTGFLMPRLQARFSALTSCAIRAVIVSLWHLPLFFYASLQHPAFTDFPYSGWIAQKGFLVAIAAHLLMFSLPLVCLLHLDLQQHQWEPVAVGCSAHLGGLDCLLDAECGDQPEQPRQLLGIWWSPGPGCDPHRPDERPARPVAQMEKDRPRAV